jgi:hypothetical protein
MATKIQVVYGETPIVGATVLAGGIGESALTTTDRGNVTLPALAEGWEGYVDVRVDTGSTIATATMHIVEGEIHVMQLGAQST